MLKHNLQTDKSIETFCGAAHYSLDPERQESALATSVRRAARLIRVIVVDPRQIRLVE